MEREIIIRMAVECQLVTTGNRDGVFMESLERFAALGAAAEREAIAKKFDGPVWSYDYREIAAAIRARGEK